MLHRNTSVPGVHGWTGLACPPAMREHLANIGDDIMRALLKVCSMSGDVFATPTPELRKAIEGLDIRLYSPYQPM